MTKIKTFSEILEYSVDIDNLIVNLEQKRSYLKEVYDNILQENTTIDVITTDTFAFQNNIFEMKIKNNKQIYYKISNQIYGDYYKLIKYITAYVNNYIKISEPVILDDTIISCVKLIENIYPYKINNYNETYNIKNAQQIYNYIVDIIEVLAKNYTKVEQIINIKQKSLNRGINIENYIQNIKYNNASLKNNIDLFETFLNSHSEYHIKYLVSLQNDINNFYNSVINEIDFNSVKIDNPPSLEITDKSNTVILENSKSRFDICKKFLVYATNYTNDAAIYINGLSEYINKNYNIIYNKSNYSKSVTKYIRAGIKVNTYMSAIIFSYLFFISFSS